jgi:hypothetical protein
MCSKKLWLFVLILLAACKKPTENIKLVIDTDIIKYTAMISATDAQTGNPIGDNAQIAILGDHAAEIYELSGQKEIQLRGGMVTIGLHPDLVPAVAEPLTVNVEITAPGYDRETRAVVFKAEEKQQVVNIALSQTGAESPPVVFPPPPVYDRTVSLNFTGKCPERKDLEIRPSVYVYFKKTGSASPFQYLGYMNKGNIKTNFLALNESYSFQIVYGGNVYQTSQKIEQDSYNLTIDMQGACNF